MLRSIELVAAGWEKCFWRETRLDRPVALKCVIARQSAGVDLRDRIIDEAWSSKPRS